MLYGREGGGRLGWRKLVVSKVRAQRIAERIREELSEILITGSLDPRIRGVSVTDVKVDRELEYASIYVSAVEGSERAPETLEGFKHAQGFLRSELARRIELRSFPRLRFYWDPTLEKAEHIERLFATLRIEEEKSGQPPNNDSDIAKDDLETGTDE
jgi:ribosome-binding factor A